MTRSPRLIRETEVVADHLAASNAVRPMVRWGPSFAGAVSTIAVSALAMALWWAIGYGSGVSFVTTNMAWFFLATVLGALLVGGAVSGRTAGATTRGVRAVDGLIVWGLTLIAALIPLTLRGLELANTGVGTPGRSTAFTVSSGNTWALFGAVVGGLVCAVVGGVVAGVGRGSTVVATRTEVEAAPSSAAAQHRAG